METFSQPLSDLHPATDKLFGPKRCLFCALAEGVGFEPTVPLQVRRFSRPVP